MYYHYEIKIKLLWFIKLVLLPFRKKEVMLPHPVVIYYINIMLHNYIYILHNWDNPVTSYNTPVEDFFLSCFFFAFSSSLARFFSSSRCFASSLQRIFSCCKYTKIYTLITLVAYTNESLVRTIQYTVQKMSHYPSNNINPGSPLFSSIINVCSIILISQK